MRIRSALAVAALLPALVLAATPARKPAAGAVSSKEYLPTIARDPCIGLIAIDGLTGRVLVETNADAVVYPASVIKLMNAFVVLDGVRQGAVRLDDRVVVTAEMAGLGGSQVYLKEREVFTVDDLLYALLVQSANDAAVALAIHAAGSQAAFVERMNRKAQELGLRRTRFFTCHGVPPTPPRRPEEVDVSTPRDLAMLGRALVACHPEILRYTATRERVFRESPKFVMSNHNHLLETVAGVDGLKTGWFRAAGYSIVVSAQRNGRRVFAAVAGSAGRLGKERDKAAAECLARAFALLPPEPLPPPSADATNAAAAGPAGSDPAPEARGGHGNGRVIAAVAGAIVAGAAIVAGVMGRRRNRAPSDTLPRPPRSPLQTPWR
jgi:D-alanyl-D-alanine carboxypeptidase (penicillin-binding protein 5/6)